ncbi:MAG: hypothetical protein IT212_07750 [Bacteroidia bacterium]|nr:hypothetical protein [Bacteroidia bacterium]
MKKHIKNNLSQIWSNVRLMTKKERKAFIKYVININRYNCGFVEFEARDFLIDLIKNSECYFNKTGKNTPVKEFEEEGI